MPSVHINGIQYNVINSKHFVIINSIMIKSNTKEDININSKWLIPNKTL